MFDGLAAFAVDRWRHDCGARRIVNGLAKKRRRHLTVFGFLHHLSLRALDGPVGAQMQLCHSVQDSGGVT
ncbi:hypothetical protein TNCV_4700231 [Trichonephila clavipes]|nr:hypothetical protein TNCV_4700231 [Trichonephila clavipes]